MAHGVRPSDGVYKSEPDPMLRALYGNILQVESHLCSLRNRVVDYLNSTRNMRCSLTELTKCFNGGAQAMSVADISGKDASTGSYSCDMDVIFLAHSSKLEEDITVKVLEPINVNLQLLYGIKKRMKQRMVQRNELAKLAKKSKDPIATLSHLESTYSEATKTLFEEMSALYEHRFEFVKSAYLALQKCQNSVASLDEIEFPDADTSEKIASPPQSPFAVRRTSSHPEENETEGYFLESTVDSFGNGSPEGEAENGGLEVIPDDHQDTETDGNESAASVERDLQGHSAC